MGKRLVIGFIVLFGLFMLPDVSVACNMHADQKVSCCHKEVAAQPASSVPVKEGVTQKNSSHNNCEGQCNPSSCQCGTMSVVVALTAVACSETRMERAAKGRMFPFNSHAIPGFYSIWLPPKIG